MKPAKNLPALFFLSAFLLLFTSSCKEDPEPEPSFTDGLAVEMAKQAISFERGGLLTQLDNSIDILSRFTSPENCGTQKDTTLAKRYAGHAVSYAYDLKLDWNMTCVNNMPSKANFNHSGTSGYSGIMLTSEDRVTSAIEISGLEASSSAYLIKKQAVREGSYTSAFKEQPSFRGKTTLSSSNIAMDKKTRQITSGVVHLSIEIDQKKPLQYQGQVTFNGTNTATLKLNSGKSYTIRL